MLLLLWDHFLFVRIVYLIVLKVLGSRLVFWRILAASVLYNGCIIEVNMCQEYQLISSTF